MLKVPAGERTWFAQHRLSAMSDLPKQPESVADQSLQGLSPSLESFEMRHDAVEKAFDYRGDVTIHTVEGVVMQGYVFDRRTDVSDPFLRLIPQGTADRVDVLYSSIQRLEFSGRDTAAGKSWETWVKKYQEKKARGEKAQLDPEPLD